MAVSIEQLKAIVERTRGALSADEPATLQAAVDTLARLTEELETTTNPGAGGEAPAASDGAAALRVVRHGVHRRTPRRGGRGEIRCERRGVAAGGQERAHRGLYRRGGGRDGQRPHRGEHLAAVLDQRQDPQAPIPMSDALARNRPGDHATQAASCIPHGRRKFVAVFEAFPDAVACVLETLRPVFRTDQRARQEGLSPAARLRLHQRESGPRLQALQDWMAKQFAERRVEPNSGLGQAITYLQNHWEKLTRFLRVPGAPLSNNLWERALKKAILHRKNSRFYRTHNGAQVGDRFMRLIHTAELHQVEPFDYLVARLRHAGAVALEPAAWMPWIYTAALARLAGEAAHPAPD